MIKKRLQQYRCESSEFQQLKEQIDCLKEKASSIRSSSDCSEIAASGGQRDKIGDLVASIVDLQNMYYEKMFRLITEQKAIELMIENLTALERLAMRAYYIDGKTWEEVAVIIGYTWRHTIRLHGKILDKLNKTIVMS